MPLATAASVVDQTTVGALMAWAAAKIRTAAVATFAVWALIAFAVVKTTVEALVTWAKARIRAVSLATSKGFKTAVGALFA